MKTPKIGLEVHVQLQTKAKLFCSCPYDYGAEANTRVCPVCLGLPGSLPTLNRQAVMLAVRGALALACEINLYSKFDRKHYFYPDLPKGYQITQQQLPIAMGGIVEISSGNVQLDHLHLEEDAGKLMHTAEGTLIDYNRSGLPLAEIVTTPSLTSARQAREFLESLRLVLLYAGVSDCKLEEGSMRCDANISIPGGSRTEIKNLNSFKAVERALEFEIKRQNRAQAEGKTIASETLRWDEARSCTVPMRTKESSPGYCYLPETDLPPLTIDAETLSLARSGIPELPRPRASRLVQEYGLSRQNADILVGAQSMADLFEETVAAGGDVSGTANLLLGEVSRLINLGEENIPPPPQLARLLALQDEGAISSTAAKKVLAQMFATGQPADAILEGSDYGQVSSQGYLEALAAKAVANNPEAVVDYLKGKEKALGRLMGVAMKDSKGKAHPALLKDTLIHHLEEMRK